MLTVSYKNKEKQGDSELTANQAHEESRLAARGVGCAGRDVPSGRLVDIWKIRAGRKLTKEAYSDF